MPFKVICIASRVALGEVLGQRCEKTLNLIYFSFKAFIPAQNNYSVIEQELLAVVFTFEKFISYFISMNIMILTNYVTFRYLMVQKNSKPEKFQWVLLLNDFDFDVEDKKKGLKIKWLTTCHELMKMQLWS